MTARAERTLTFAPASAGTGGVSSLAPGIRLGKYTLVAPLASGGMGQVFIASAEDAPDTPYAIKTVLPSLASDERFRSLFLREARLASVVRHPNVVEVLECGEVEGHLYEVMPLVEGDSIHGLMERHHEQYGTRQLPMGLVVRAIVDALRGLHAAHETRGDDGDLLGIVHRDVSPQNILIDVHGSAKLTDFGIAKALYVTGDVTATGDVKGKTSYLSPEQVAAHPIDRRSDLFSMGVVLWEAIAGARLFRDDNPFETLRRIRELEVPALPDLRADCPASVGNVVATALQRRPDRRYPSARLMADALEDAASELGHEASQERAAEYVRSLVSVAIERQRDAWRRREPRGAFTPAMPVSPKAHTRARRAWPLVVVTAFLVLGGVTAWAMKSRQSVPSRGAAAPQLQAAAMVGDHPSAESTESASPKSEATPAAVAPSAALEPAPGTKSEVSAHPRTRHRATRPAAPLPRATTSSSSSPTPRRSLPFDKNVYEP